jgi:alpha-galactosidase
LIVNKAGGDMRSYLTGFLTIVLLVFSFFAIACEKGIIIEGEEISIEFDPQLNSRVISEINGERVIVGEFGASEYIQAGPDLWTIFPFKSQKTSHVEDQIGTGTLYTIIGESKLFRKTINATVYEDFPRMAFFSVTYENISDKPLEIEGWTNNRYMIASDPAQKKKKLWSFQSGSYENRPDWILPVSPGFKQENYLGMNASDYGGGIPVSDVWREDLGIAVGHVEMAPKLISLPVEMEDSRGAFLRVTKEIKKNLEVGEKFSTPQTFVSVHKGDCFESLADYRAFMIKKGIKFDPPQETAYEPIWCAWGYERNFNVNQVLNTLPKVKELGYKWAVLDDGWQTAEGDWFLNKKKFPRGDQDMKKFVDKIHSYDLKAKLWWAPMSVDPGTDLIKNHPEYLLLNKDGSKQKISWWNAWYLCPAYPEVQEFTRGQVNTIMETWGYDGLKIDGQHLNAAPPCYNPAHNHERPEESVEKVPEYFKVIYETALAIKPDAVVEICPCGTACSFFNMPVMNQPVSSDPTSSWQIRTKGKTFKALMGPTVAYYGDHVELSDNKSDFASTVGIGGVIGTKFTWPVGEHLNRESGDVSLTPEKEAEWKKWIDIYQNKMLPKGEYLGQLYDVGFDRPEAHGIKKDRKMYYAFYADKWDGPVELRGLEDNSYKLVDYVNEKDYGQVNGPTHKLKVQFDKFLLLEAIPEN